MRITEVAKLFVGSCLVYVVVAACSAYGGDEPSSSSGGSSGTTTSSSGDGSSSADTSIVNPIGNALAQGHKSGSRLKLRFYEGADGSRQFIDFFDTQLQTTCQVPGRTADGKERCVPPPAGSPYYSAAGCTGAPTLYAVAKSDPQPKVLIVNGTPLTAYTSGALTNPPAKIFLKFIGQGSCIEQDSTPLTHNYYAVGAPMADTEFVEMTIKTE